MTEKKGSITKLVEKFKGGNGLLRNIVALVIAAIALSGAHVAINKQGREIDENDQRISRLVKGVKGLQFQLDRAEALTERLAGELEARAQRLADQLALQLAERIQRINARFERTANRLERNQQELVDELRRLFRIVKRQ